MKTVLCLFMLMIVLFVVPTALPQNSSSSPEAIVRAFYSYYLHELNRENSNPLKQRATALKYLTPQLQANAPRLTRRMDADIFICAQDWEQNWERDFIVGPVKVTGTTATTLVTLPSGNDKIKIRVTLKKINVGWRIDGVKCAT